MTFDESIILNLKKENVDVDKDCGVNVHVDLECDILMKKKDVTVRPLRNKSNILVRRMMHKRNNSIVFLLGDRGEKLDNLRCIMAMQRWFLMHWLWHKLLSFRNLSHMLKLSQVVNPYFYHK